MPGRRKNPGIVQGHLWTTLQSRPEQAPSAQKLQGATMAADQPQERSFFRLLKVQCPVKCFQSPRSHTEYMWSLEKTNQAPVSSTAGYKYSLCLVHLQLAQTGTMPAVSKGHLLSLPALLFLKRKASSTSTLT